MKINNAQDVIDSRDIMDRIKELELLNTEEQEELKVLKALEVKASGCSGWEDGATFISEYYFTEYIQDMLEDSGIIPENLPWYIEDHIDWDGVVRDLKGDYTSIDFDGVEYLILA